MTGLARRGLLEPRDRGRSSGGRSPAASPGARGSRPAGAALDPGAGSDARRARSARGARGAAERLALLLEGETASGKTAVYAAAIADALGAGRGALVLVPEIALATPLIDRLRHDLGRRRRPAPQRARGRGARRRVAAHPRGDGRASSWARGWPCSLRRRTWALIVVDEEHDAGLQVGPDAALPGARRRRSRSAVWPAHPVVLGSATPDIVTLGRAEQGIVEPRATGRAGSRAPGRSSRSSTCAPSSRTGNRGLLSAPLVDALAGLDRAAGERAILVINRRGAASVVLCRDCGYVQICPDCQRPLVFHATGVALRCHHCGATAPVARRCPACGSPRIRYLGGGTERVEQEVGVRFPELRVARLDRDVVERRGAAARVIDAFTEGAIDVLVGHEPRGQGPRRARGRARRRRLGGHRAQPARRAGRGAHLAAARPGGRPRRSRATGPGRAIIQTYLPDHPVIRAVASGDARPFVEAELERRRRFGSPPFGQLIKLTAADADRDAALAAARAFAAELRDRVAATGASVAVLGPVPAYVARRGGRWRFHVVLRGRDPAAVLGGDPGRPGASTSTPRACSDGGAGGGRPVLYSRP